MWPSITSEGLLHLMKILHLYNVSVHRNFYQNQFINEYARKKMAKIPNFLVRYRRTSFSQKKFKFIVDTFSTFITTKVVHNNVSQGCDWARPKRTKKIKKPLHIIKVTSLYEQIAYSSY